MGKLRLTQKLPNCNQVVYAVTNGNEIQVHYSMFQCKIKNEGHRTTNIAKQPTLIVKLELPRYAILCDKHFSQKISIDINFLTSC